MQWGYPSSDSFVVLLVHSWGIVVRYNGLTMNIGVLYDLMGV